MMARRGAGGGLPVPCGAPVAPAGGDRRNLRIAFENLSTPAEPAPRLEAGGPPLKRSNLAQAVIHIGAMLAGFLLVSSAAVGVGASIVILFCGQCR